MQEFCEVYDLENLIKEPACFKNPSNPSSIDVMLTNKKCNFHNSMTLETALSDHNKMTNSAEIIFSKKAPVTINYRDYKSFDEHIDYFKNIFMTFLNTYSPMKKKIGNKAPFMNKTLSKEFMHRSKLKNIYHKEPTESNKNRYIKQRNFCVNLLKNEKIMITTTLI